MPDLVVTVPKSMWQSWLAEGALPGEAMPDDEDAFDFYVGRAQGKPPIEPGERLYVVAYGRLRGFAPVVGVERCGPGWVIRRRDGAVACTVEREIVGFRGWRHVDWSRDDERPFPDWRVAGVEAPAPLLDGLR